MSLSVEVPQVTTFEPFVSADVVAGHLSVNTQKVLKLTREGKIPAHPVDPDAQRKTWRYKLSEVEKSMTEKTDVERYNPRRSPRSKQ